MAAGSPADTHDEAHCLYVAGRAGDEHEGLYRWDLAATEWRGRHLATARELSALAEHPLLPVVYGVSAAEEGRIYAWRVPAQGSGQDAASVLGDVSSGGADACHVAVDPEGRTLIVVNYAHGSIAVQRLATDGSLDSSAGGSHVEKLCGSSVDPDRQEAPHPHQAIFHDGHLFVTDLGADLLREYRLDGHSLTCDALIPVRETAVPPGTGPRHAVVLPDGRFAISGELASTVVVGRPGAGPDTWVVVPSTLQDGPAKTRHVRNYPGDIKSSGDGRFIHVANRGYDTITTYDVTDAEPRFVCEVDAEIAWPQHLLVVDGELLVAGWDSSRVVALPLADGHLGDVRVLFDCPGAAWLMAARLTTSAH
jgi:6-phosphogluconolactonase (cycloisomerase 2 family)